jgi:hypothetical protein
VIGNEVTTATSDGGLQRAGSGTAAAPYTLGIAKNGVTTERINDGAVTAIKLNSMSATNGQVLKWSNNTWAPAADAGLTSESDGVIGNEVTAATSGGGLQRAGAGTATAPYTLGIADDAVTTLRIQDGAVTAKKLNSMSATNGQVLKYTTNGWAAATLAASDVAGGSGGGYIIVKNGAYSGPTEGTVDASLTGDYSSTWTSTAFTALDKDLAWAPHDSPLGAVQWSALGTPCPSGWRRPNLMEMHVFYQALGGGGGPAGGFYWMIEAGKGSAPQGATLPVGLWATTKATSSQGHIFNFVTGNRVAAISGTTSQYVRCVKTL